MEKNPFNELIGIVKDISKSNITENKLFNIGVVISPLPDLIIKTSNIECITFSKHYNSITNI